MLRFTCGEKEVRVKDWEILSSYAHDCLQNFHFLICLLTAGCNLPYLSKKGHRRNLEVLRYRI